MTFMACFFLKGSKLEKKKRSVKQENIFLMRKKKYKTDIIRLSPGFDRQQHLKDFIKTAFLMQSIQTGWLI